MDYENSKNNGKYPNSEKKRVSSLFFTKAFPERIIPTSHIPKELTPYESILAS